MRQFGWQKFTVDDSGVGHFEPGDRLVLVTGGEGNTTIALDNGDGVVEEGRSKGRGRALRQLGAGHGRQRYAVGTENSDPLLTLDSDERLVVGQDREGNVTIDVAPANGSDSAHDPGLEVEVETASRGLRMTVADNIDGTLTLSPDAGMRLEVGGNVNGGVAIVTELPALNGA